MTPPQRPSRSWGEGLLVRTGASVEGSHRPPSRRHSLRNSPGSTARSSRSALDGSPKLSCRAAPRPARDRVVRRRMETLPEAQVLTWPWPSLSCATVSGGGSPLPPPQPSAIPCQPMAKRFHVTTFGCQMNVHDSERMRGMLASLGYEEAESRDEADLILFNTCSIRESADSRFIAHLGEAKRLKSEDAGADRRGRRLLGAVGQGGGLPALSLRRRRLRAGADPQAGRVPQLRLAQRPGLLRVRGLRRPPADPARARVPGLAADLPGLQLRLLLLHRPLDPGQRGQPRPRRAADRGRGAGRRRGARGDPAGPERQQLRPRPAARAAASASPSCWPGSTRSRGSSGSATPARTRRT